MYEQYIKVAREGLAEWEYNTKQMMGRLENAPTSCPLLTKCDEHIRLLHPDGKYFSCGAFGDDQEYEIDFKKEVLDSGKPETPLQDDPTIKSLKAECFSCPMYQICNGCHKHIKDLKRSGLVERHCTKMKSIAEDIINLTETYGQQF